MPVTSGFHIPKAINHFQGKGLSVTRPWATAIAYAGKTIENRPWRTRYRGPLAIHASGTFRRHDLNWPQRVVRGGEKCPLIRWNEQGWRRYGLEPEERPNPGHIIAMAMVTGCVERSASPRWFRGEFGWVLERVIPIEPIAWSGGLSLWNRRFKYHPLRRKR